MSAARERHDPRLGRGQELSSSRPVSAKWPRWLVPSWLSKPSFGQPSRRRHHAGVIDQQVDAVALAGLRGRELARRSRDRRGRAARPRAARRAPPPRIAEAASSSLAVLRAAITTLAPARASSRAVTRPSPLFAPVTTATRPAGRGCQRPSTSSSSGRTHPDGILRETESEYAPWRKRSTGSFDSSIPSTTRVGSNTSTSPPVSRSVSSPVSSSVPARDAAALLRPVRGGIVDVVACLGELQLEREPHRSRGKPVADLLLQVVGPTAFGLARADADVACLGQQRVAHELRAPPASRTCTHGRRSRCMSRSSRPVAARGCSAPAASARPDAGRGTAASFQAIAAPGPCARSSSMKASGVRTGNRGADCATMSVREPSGRYSLTASPRTSGA